MITLDKAIEILTDELHHAPCLVEPDIKDAVQLSIEAIRRIKFGRNHPSGWELEPLPGEDSNDGHGIKPSATKKLRKSPLGGK